MKSNSSLLDLSALLVGIGDRGNDSLDITVGTNNIQRGSVSIESTNRFDSLGNISNTFNGSNNLTFRGDSGDINLNTAAITSRLEISQETLDG